MSKKKQNKKNKSNPKTETVLGKIMNQIEEKKEELTLIDPNHEPFTDGCPNAECLSNDVYYSGDLKGLCLACGMEWEYTSDGEVVELIDDSKASYLSPDYNQVKEFEKSDTQKLIESKLGIAQQKSLPGYPHKGTNVNYGASSYDVAYAPSCAHAPTHVISSESGYGIWAGKKDDCKLRANDFDIVLNLTYNTIKEYHRIPIDALKKYECPDTFTELQIDWPDFSVPNLPKEFWIDLWAHVKKEKKRVLVFCMGGHGRTGTAIACLMVAAEIFSPKEAIAWVRKNYCNSAIESMSQERYIERMETLKAESASASSLMN